MRTLTKFQGQSCSGSRERPRGRIVGILLRVAERPRTADACGTGIPLIPCSGALLEWLMHELIMEKPSERWHIWMCPDALSCYIVSLQRAGFYREIVEFFMVDSHELITPAIGPNRPIDLACKKGLKMQNRAVKR